MMHLIHRSMLCLAIAAAGCVHVEYSHVDGEAGVWRGLTQESVQLNQKLLVVKGSRGIVVCPYLSIDALEATGETAAIISSPDFDGLPDSSVIAVTLKGEALGLRVGMKGTDALNLIR